MESHKPSYVALADDQLVAIWLHGRPANTRAAYGREIGKLRRSLGAPLATVQLVDLQRFADELQHLALRSQARAIDAVRSFYGHHAKVGTLPSNPAVALRSPKIPNDLAERILTEDEVFAVIAAAERDEKLMLRALYTSGARASELCGLRWRNVTPRDDKVQLALYGKGGKTRFILLPPDVSAALLAHRPAAAKPADPVFQAPADPAHPMGRWHLDRVIKRAAERAGLRRKIGAHHFRHANASHSLKRGATISVVQQSLGHTDLKTTAKYLHVAPGDSSALYLRTGS